MSCNYYRGKCLFLNGKEDGCKGCPIKKAYNKGVRDTKKDYRQQGEWIDRMTDKGYVECPFCHKQITGGDLNFCVKCGARMRADEL